MRLSLGSLDVNADEVGSGEPVVMIHSSGMSSRQWRGLAKVLSSSHHVVMPDLLACGGTRGWVPKDDFSIAEDVELVLAVVRQLDRPVHLVGHSYGGMLALCVARALPVDRVKSLSLYEPVAWGAAFDEPGGPVAAQLAAFGDGFFAFERGGSAEWFETFIDFWNGPGAWRALPDPQKNAFLAVGRKVFLEVRSLCFDRTPPDAYRVLTMPTLLLSGGKSPRAERRVCEVLAETMPNAKLEVFPELGHMGILVAGDVVNARIAAHVRAAG